MPLTYRLASALARFLNSITAACGRGIAWLTPLMVLVTSLIVLARMAGYGSIAAQESVTYMHALVICLASAYTLQVDGHVRVDIFYRNLSPAGKAWINALGTVVFLLPVAVFIVASSYSYVLSAWSIREGSGDAGGLPAVFLLKSLVLVVGVLLIVQALAELILALCELSFTGDAHG